MPERISRDFPLFPLGIVALPSESVPLHVFEDRYRRMIERCLGGEPGSIESQFGIIWLSDQELKPVGCACEIERVLERMDDGRMNILSRGTRAFRLLERQDELPYPAGTVEFLADAEEAPDEEAASVAREHYRDLVEQATDRSMTAAELAELDAYGMAATGAGASERCLEAGSWRSSWIARASTSSASLSFGALTPLQCTAPSSLTSSVRWLPGPGPVRSTTKRSGARMPPQPTSSSAAPRAPSAAARLTRSLRRRRAAGRRLRPAVGHVAAPPARRRRTGCASRRPPPRHRSRAAARRFPARHRRVRPRNARAAHRRPRARSGHGRRRRRSSVAA